MSEALVVRRTIRAPLERVFAAWTQAERVRRWFGPGQGEKCIGAEVDLRVGGCWRIGILQPDGAEVWIAGEFEAVEPPRRLVYSWRFEPAGNSSERVTVRFEDRPEGTEVIVEHEGIATEPSRRGHEQGWLGCLAGLSRYTEKA